MSKPQEPVQNDLRKKLDNNDKNKESAGRSVQVLTESEQDDVTRKLEEEERKLVAEERKRAAEEQRKRDADIRRREEEEARQQRIEAKAEKIRQKNLEEQKSKK